MMQHLYGLKNLLHEQGIFFCLSGPISQNLVTEIGAILEQKMSMENASRTTILRVFSLVVEKMQNIIHYSDEKTIIDESSDDDLEKPLSFGIIAIGYDHERYFVLSGNLIATHKVERLQQKLQQIQRMSKEELKEFYREQRRKDPETGSKGAGLGLLEIAKKASAPIEFDFTPVDKHVSFFSMKTII